MRKYVREGRGGCVMVRFLLVVCLWCCSVGGVEVMEFRCEVPKGGKLYIEHGTCFMYRGFVITAAHTVNPKGTYYALSADKSWIACDLVKIDRSVDVDTAVLKPRLEARFESFLVVGCACCVVVRGVSGVQVLFGCLAVVSSPDNRATFKGFDVGGSGAPVVQDDRLVGMAHHMNKKDSSVLTGLTLVDVVDKLLPVEVVK